MRMVSFLTLEELRTLLSYDPETGIFLNVVQRNPRAPQGAEAGRTRDDGYRVIFINRQAYYAHRLAWLWMTGEWPDRQIDHRDRDPSNNRWSNLRMATQRENNRNMGKSTRNTSGFKGVSWHKSREKWRATINIDGKTRHIGYGNSAEEAFELIKPVRESLHQNFTNHGE